MKEPLKSSILKTKGPSVIPAVLILCGGVLVLTWDVFSGVLVPTKGIALILASVGYLLIRKRIPSNLKMATSTSLPGKPSISLILNILFLIAFSYTLIAVVTSQAYSMPMSYFISTVVMCLVIALDIFLMPNENTTHTKVILLKIIVLSLLLIWIPYYKFPNIGTDPWYHMSFIGDMLRESRIPLIGHEFYQNYPAMHLIVGEVQEITGLGTQNLMMVIGSMGVISLLFLFCLGKILFNEKAGLLAALFLGFSNDFIFWGYYVIPMTLGLSLTMALIYLVIKRATVPRKLPFTVLFLLLMVVLIYTHTIAALVFFTIIASMYLGQLLIRLRSGGRLRALLSLETPLLFGVAMIFYWLYISGFLLETIVPNIKRAFSFLPSEFEYPILPSDITLSVLNNIGLFFLIGLGAMAILYCWDHRKDYRISLILVSAGLGTTIVLYAAFFSGQASIILPERWEVFIFVLLSAFTAWGVLLIYYSFRDRLLKLLSVSLIVLILSFAMIATSLSGHSNPLADKGGSDRGFFFDSEIAAAATISNFYDGEIISDNFYDSYFEYTHDKEIGNIYDSFIVPDDPEVNGAIVIRKYILNYIFKTRRPEEQIRGYVGYSVLLDEAQKDKVISLNEDPRYSKIYSNNEVVTYLP